MSLFNKDQKTVKTETQTAQESVPNVDFWKGIKYFKPSEFDSPDMPNSGLLMNHDFITKLDKARDNCGFPFHINSGFRSPAHNASLSGASITSTHLTGHGVDIRANTIDELRTMEKVLRELGFNSIGLYKWTSSGRYHVHVDTRNRNVTWHMKDGKKDKSWYI